MSEGKRDLADRVGEFIEFQRSRGVEYSTFGEATAAYVRTLDSLRAKLPKGVDCEFEF